MPKTQLIDRAGNAGSFGLAVAFYAAFFILLIAGGAGPQQQLFESLPNLAPLSTACSGPPPFVGCETTFSSSVAASSYNQDVWVTVQMLRPTDTSTGKMALPNVALQYDQWLYIDVDAVHKDGVRTQVINNRSMVAANMFCPRTPPGARAEEYPCGSSIIFTQSFITAERYEISFRAFEPLAPFTDNGVVALSGNVTWVVTAGKINDKFTSFQARAAGWAAPRAPPRWARAAPSRMRVCVIVEGCGAACRH